MNHSERITDLLISLHAFQAEVTEPGKDSRNPHLKNKYASLPAVRAHCQPLLTKYNLGITQLPCSQDGHPGVETVLFHGPTGQWIQSRILMPAFAQKGLNDPQVVGVIITYLRRYSWLAILGLSSEDNDAADASPRQDSQSQQATNDSGRGNGAQGDPGQFASNDSWKQVIRDFIRGPLSMARGSRYTAGEVDALCRDITGRPFVELDEAGGVKFLKALEDEGQRLRMMEAPRG